MGEKNRAWIELSRENLAYNVERLQSLIPKECRLMPAVKADAYGHGMVLIAGMLANLGIEDFCVACADEGIKLRQAGITGQILVLGYTYPRQFDKLVDYDLTQTVVDSHYAQELQRFGKEIKVHVGIDTGMHRLGERCEKTEAIRGIWDCDHLRITGIFSHLCVADSPDEKDRVYTLEQIHKFEQTIEELRKSGIEGFSRHLQGSYGILNYPWLAYEHCRPGIALYGLLSNEEDKHRCSVDLRPVMELKTRVQSVRTVYAGEGAGYGLDFQAKKDSCIAALSIGYADGIPRELSGRGHVLIGGKKAPIIGRICMDQMLVDVSAIPKVKAGDEAVLIGGQRAEQITGEQFAGWCNTITNELFSRLGSRLERMEK
ncbi:MAG: serine racemase VanT catalytic subunit [Lachnospiraceae bacterium]|nr:serine racemase VanT catalytic subunit [Lachnospiraceae bacterium]